MELVRELFREYQNFLNFDLCFQSFESELAGLPGDYAPPSGALLLAESEQQVVGCVALRALDEKTCEMKRLYVRPQGRGLGRGRKLCEVVIERARDIGYQSMKLDTVSKLQKAIALYREFGFQECDAYCHNPQPDVLYLELKL